MTTQTVSQAVEKRDNGIVKIMWGYKAHIEAVLPDHIDVKSFLGTAAAALYGNPKLMEHAQANPDSLIAAVMECASLGHRPGTEEYYLTPRQDHGRPKVLGIEGYRGVVERMYRSGGVATVIVREVCSGDPFRYVEGDDEKPIHLFGGQGRTGGDFFGVTGSRDRGPMVGVYAVAKLTTGAWSRPAILTRDDVEAARAAGGWKPGDQYSPWNRLDAGKDHPEFTGRSMWWKTAAKRLEPWVPTSAEYRREQLRAAAQAAPLPPAPAPPVPAPGNGHAAAEEPVDAEIVEDTPTGARPATGSGSTDGHAPTEAAQPAKRQSRQAASADKLMALVKRLDLGTEEDVAALFHWQLGQPYNGDTGHVRHMTGYLSSHLEACQGDTAEAASAIWAQFRAMNAQDAAAEGSQDGPSDG
jgi:recombination protein RecT